MPCCADIHHNAMNSLPGLLTVPIFSTMKSVKWMKYINIKVLCIMEDLTDKIQSNHTQGKCHVNYRPNLTIK